MIARKKRKQHPCVLSQSFNAHNNDNNNGHEGEDADRLLLSALITTNSSDSLSPIVITAAIQDSVDEILLSLLLDNPDANSDEEPLPSPSSSSPSGADLLVRVQEALQKIKSNVGELYKRGEDFGAVKPVEGTHGDHTSFIGVTALIKKLENNKHSFGQVVVKYKDKPNTLNEIRTIDAPFEVKKASLEGKLPLVLQSAQQQAGTVEKLIFNACETLKHLKNHRDDNFQDHLLRGFTELYDTIEKMRDSSLSLDRVMAIDASIMCVLKQYEFRRQELNSRTILHDFVSSCTSVFAGMSLVPLDSEFILAIRHKLEGQNVKFLVGVADHLYWDLEQKCIVIVEIKTSMVEGIPDTYKRTGSTNEFSPEARFLVRPTILQVNSYGAMLDHLLCKVVPKDFWGPNGGRPPVGYGLIVGLDPNQPTTYHIWRSNYNPYLYLTSDFQKNTRQADACYTSLPDRPKPCRPLLRPMFTPEQIKNLLPI